MSCCRCEGHVKRALWSKRQKCLYAFNVEAQLILLCRIFRVLQHYRVIPQIKTVIMVDCHDGPGPTQDFGGQEKRTSPELFKDGTKLLTGRLQLHPFVKGLRPEALGRHKVGDASALRVSQSRNRPRGYNLL